MENIVAKKLEALLKLQAIDSKLDEIKKMFVYDYEFKHYTKRYLEL